MKERRNSSSSSLWLFMMVDDIQLHQRQTQLRLVVLLLLASQSVSSSLLSSSSSSSSLSSSSALRSLVGYIPQWSEFWDAAQIDLDVMAIRQELDYTDVIFVSRLEEEEDKEILEEYMSHKNQSLPINSINRIQNIYERGAYSQSYANLTILHEGGISQFLPQGTTLTGISRENHIISGIVMQDTPVGSTYLSFQYIPRKDGHLIHCFVGGLPIAEQILSGCLVEGNSEEEPILIQYNSEELMCTYNYLGDNRNARTLATFSQTARDRMHNCLRCPYKTYEKFFRYYGTFDYAHQIVSAALDEDYTNFKLGNLDFTTSTIPGRIAAVSSAVLFLHIWMYILRQLEYALDQCWEATIGEAYAGMPELAIYAWDEAVAYYVGSTESLSDVDGHGVLLYTLADQLCRRFGTCGESSNEVLGTAYTNIRILRAFRIGQNDVKYGHCDAATKQKEEIEQWMVIPLLQSTLEQLYELSRGEDNNSMLRIMEIQGTLSILVASIVPLIHSCNEADAKLFQQSVAPILSNSNTPPSKQLFRQITSILEKQYPCFGLSCETVGILIHAPYYGSTCQKNNSTMAASTIAGIFIFLVVFILLGILMFQRYRRKKRTKQSQESWQNTNMISDRPASSPELDGAMEHVIL